MDNEKEIEQIKVRLALNEKLIKDLATAQKNLSIAQMILSIAYLIHIIAATIL